MSHNDCGCGTCNGPCSQTEELTPEQQAMLDRIVKEIRDAYELTRLSAQVMQNKPTLKTFAMLLLGVGQSMGISAILREEGSMGEALDEREREFSKSVATSLFEIIDQFSRGENDLIRSIEIPDKETMQ